MNILLIGEYNDENKNFFQKFDNTENVIIKRFWTNGELCEDCFFGEPESESFKMSVYNMFFDIAFEPDVVFVVGQELLDCWAVSFIKRTGYISSKCFSLFKKSLVPFDGLTIAVLESFDKNFSLDNSVDFLNFYGFLKEKKDSGMSDELLDSIIDSILLVENNDLLFEKILKEICNREKNIVSSEVVV